MTTYSPKPMREYKNGNCAVKLFADGTKIREWDGVPKPEFPESVDLKVTNKCYNACKFCHECSEPDGAAAEPSYVRDITRTLPAGVELAIGGGDPLTWKALPEVAWDMRRQGIVPNLTVNEQSLTDYKQTSYFKSLMCLFYGIGWSGDPCILDINMIPDDKIVYHLIAGIDNPNTCFSDLDKAKVLILGFKQFGRGKQFYNPSVETNLRHWRFKLKAILSRKGITSFDNLALEQLNVRQIVGEKTWRQYYMGDDGCFTMYVDAVKKEYAVSSISQRKPMGEMNIKEAFQALQKER